MREEGQEVVEVKEVGENLWEVIVRKVKWNF
jgi:hypothetical protein